MPMHPEQLFHERIPSSDMEIIGTGTIGEKARQLRDKTPVLKTLGFRVPRRTVLAGDFLKDAVAQDGTFFQPEGSHWNKFFIHMAMHLLSCGLRQKETPAEQGHRNQYLLKIR